jgi:hypothetical protein
VTDAEKIVPLGKSQQAPCFVMNNRLDACDVSTFCVRLDEERMQVVGYVR